MSEPTVRHQTEKMESPADKPIRHCGIIMPIAAMAPDYESAHWVRVKDVLSDAIIAADFSPRLVSESDEVGVIHGQIVQNLYDDEIVVCDVSGKNPNVMFELGLRLAFDKPTIIVQDDSNGYSFDIGPIKHIGYRRDQRFDDVQEFKDKVKTAIVATLAKKEADENFSPFLKHFGHFTPKKVENQEVPQAEFIMKKLDAIERRLGRTMLIPERGNINVIGGFVDPTSKRPDLSNREMRLFDLMREQIRILSGDAKNDKTRDLDAVKRTVGGWLINEIPHEAVTDERWAELFELAWDMEYQK